MKSQYGIIQELKELTDRQQATKKQAKL